MKIETELDLKIAVIGLPNAGKTSTISSFLQMDIGSMIGPDAGETKYRYPYDRSYEGNVVYGIDTPGFQDIDHIDEFFKSNKSISIKDYIEEYKSNNTEAVRRNVEAFRAIEDSDFVIYIINAHQYPNEDDKLLVEMVREYILREKPMFFFINEYKEDSRETWEEYLKNQGIRYILYDAHNVTIENSINAFEYFKQGIEDDRIKIKCERLIRSIRDDFNKKLTEIIKETISEFHFTFENYKCMNEYQAGKEFCKKLNKLAENCRDKIHSKFNFKGGLEKINITGVDLEDVTPWWDKLLNKIPIYPRIPNRTFVINDPEKINEIFDKLISDIFAIILCSHARTGRSRGGESLTIRNGKYFYELKEDSDYNKIRNEFFKNPKVKAKRDKLTKYIVSKICKELNISTCDG